MLVLSRKLGEAFCVGEGVRIKVVKIDNHTVRIGIEAPGQVPVQREEILRQRPAKHKTSASTKAAKLPESTGLKSCYSSS
jgi:carbon storage regulator